ncbi:MAG: hypothetical protein ACHQF4_02125 [Sphingobacteriales bacterium]
MNTFIGYFGTVLLLVAYASLLTRSYSKYFVPIDVVASAILTVHAILLHDIPFIIVNALVTIMLAVKFSRKETV